MRKWFDGFSSFRFQFRPGPVRLQDLLKDVLMLAPNVPTVCGCSGTRARVWGEFPCAKVNDRNGEESLKAFFLLFFFPFLHHCSALRVDGIICSRVLPVKPLECQLDFRSQQTVSEVLGVRPGSIPSRPFPYAGIINLSEIRWPILHDSARAACSKTNIWG